MTDRPSAPQSHIVMHNQGAGAGSLHDLIENACPEDTIRFSPMMVGDTFHLASCDINIDRNLVIVGNGVTETILSGNGLQNMFIAAQHVELTVESLQIIDNNSQNSTNNLCFEGCLTLQDVVVTGF